MKVLIVEDKVQLADAIRDYLRMNKCEVTALYDGAEGYIEAKKNIYDVIILDLMLPNMSGNTIIRRLRNEQIDTPILVLTAKSTTDDKVEALLDGADDYLTKPFVLEELLARLFALSRRKGRVLPNDLTYGDLSLDTINHTIKKGAKEIYLSAKEFQIMELLLTSGEKVFSKEEMVEKIWGKKPSGDTSIEVYVTFLRKKLRILNSTIHIKSVRCIGYRLTPYQQDETEIKES